MVTPKELVAVVDYGMGNIGSVKNMLNYLGYGCFVASCYQEVAQASSIILPGVGHYKKAMANIRKREFHKAIEYAIYEHKTHVLGICLGMQLLMDYSEEGECDGLGYIQGKVKKFNDINLPVPHMGWNTVEYVESAQDLYNEDEARYYFVHSYYVQCDDREDIMALTEYGIKFVSAVQKESIMGVQFHPEKSHIYGMQFFRKYMEMTKCTTIE